MGRPKINKDDVRLSVVLTKKQAERIKYMALRRSTQERRQITVSEARIELTTFALRMRLLRAMSSHLTVADTRAG